MMYVGMNTEQSLQILSSKKFKKEDASSEGDEQAGRQGETLRERRESSVDHNFLGRFEHCEMRVQ